MSGTTPGRAAYEAHAAATGPRIGWERLADRHRDAWDAAAQAAIATAPTAILQFSGELSEQELAELREQLAAITSEHDAKPAPELAAAMAETRQFRELVTEILGYFGPSGSGHTARVGQVQIAKWRERAGIKP